MSDALKKYGWTDYFAAMHADHAEKGLQAGRIAIEHKQTYTLYTSDGELGAEVSGKLRHEADGLQDFPAVGDWVAFKPLPGENRGVIRALLPRRSKFSRKSAGHHVTEQVVAANIDYVFIVSSLNLELNPRRIERYLALAWESGAIPVVVLNKADLCEDIDAAKESIESVCIGVDVIIVSALTGDNIEILRPYFENHKTCSLLGSSGVGKSTIVNALAGEAIQRVQEIREGDNKGRHTTTRRELIVLPDGGLIIDTPGMREIQLWDADQGLDEAFEDIAALAKGCRFADCRHLSEPGCAVKAAVEAGSLDGGRYTSYTKLLKELEHLHRQQDIHSRLAAKKKNRILHREIKRINKNRLK